MKYKWHSKKIFLLLILLALFLMQGAPFLKGYRLTADDVFFHQLMFDGWSVAWSEIKRISFGQGRISHFIDLPLALVGDYFADSYWFRVFYTSLYFSNFILLGSYASLILFNRFLYHAVALIALILISLHPLDYYHLAPTAYPFHISAPVFLILISRINIFILRGSTSSKSSDYESGWLAVCFVGMLLNEKGFLFGFAIIFIECFHYCVVLY